MTSDAAELSAVATALDELNRRILGVAERYEATPREDVAADLYEVERSFRSASRRLNRLVRELS